jgi:hypothetical protein
MNNELLPHERVSPPAYAALKDAATQRAIALRRAAIDAYATGLAQRLRAAWRTLAQRASALRAAHRVEV